MKKKTKSAIRWEKIKNDPVLLAEYRASKKKSYKKCRANPAWLKKKRATQRANRRRRFKNDPVFRKKLLLAHRAWVARERAKDPVGFRNKIKKQNAKNQARYKKLAKERALAYFWANIKKVKNKQARDIITRYYLSPQILWEQKFRVMVCQILFLLDKVPHYAEYPFLSPEKNWEIMGSNIESPTGTNSGGCYCDLYIPGLAIIEIKAPYSGTAMQKLKFQQLKCLKEAQKKGEFDNKAKVFGLTADDYDSDGFFAFYFKFLKGK